MATGTGQSEWATRFTPPVFALKVGLVGNRRFARAADGDQAVAPEQQVTDACAEIWMEIARIMAEVRRRPLPGAEGGGETLANFFAPGPAFLNILTGLAAGVDQLGARAALRCAEESLQPGASPLPVTVRLEGIMPFPAADFPGPVDAPRPEFTPEEAKECEALALACAQTVRLDGAYGRPGDEADDRGRNAAYRQVRDMILQNSDLLVAVYDPAAAAKPAGTAETVRLALANGLPVVAVLIDPAGVRAAVYRRPSDLPDDAPPAAGLLSDDGWRESLRRTLDYLLSLPHAVEPESEEPYEQQERLRAGREVIERLDVFYARPDSRHPTGGPHRFAVFAWSWRFIGWLGWRSARPHGFIRYKVPKPNPAADTAPDLPPYSRACERADALSTAYMEVYRGAFPLAFLLAGVATAAAVGMMVVSGFTSGHPPQGWVLTLGLLKIVILLSLLWLEHSGHRHRWQECAAEYRYMAELLRPMPWLAPVGALAPLSPLPAQYAPLDPAQGWMHWLFRALARGELSVARVGNTARTVEFNTGTARQTLTDACDGWLEGQRLYHWKAAQNSHAIENGLEHIAKRFLHFVLICAVVALILESYEHSLPDPGESLSRLALVLTAIAAALPAFIAALGGIIFQSEAKRLELRSETMFHGLRAQQAALRAAVDALASSPASGATRDAAARLRDLAGLTIAETGDWKVLYQMQEIKAG